MKTYTLTCNEQLVCENVTGEQAAQIVSFADRMRAYGYFEITNQDGVVFQWDHELNKFKRDLNNNQQEN